MTSAHSNTPKLALPSELSGKWGWFVALGVVLLILGFVAFGNLVFATEVTVYYIGILMLVAGVVELIHAFGVKTWSSFFFWLLSGLIYAAAGVVTFMNPLLAASIFTIFLAIALVAAGILRIWAGIQSKPATGWGWIVAAGIITLLAGIVIAMQWPINSLFILGLFLAVDLIFQGWSYIAFGLGIKR